MGQATTGRCDFYPVDSGTPTTASAQVGTQALLSKSVVPSEVLENQGIQSQRSVLETVNNALKWLSRASAKLIQKRFVLMFCANLFFKDISLHL